jgi:DNA-binding transcriptional regulator YiaG
MNTQSHDSLTNNRSTFASFGDPGDRNALKVIIVSGSLALAGTAAAEPDRIWEDPYEYEASATASGPRWGPEIEDAQDVVLQTHETEATRKAISELRRISGLTWEQLGNLFEVSRRSVHHWASGKPLNSSNEERLMRVLAVVRFAYRGSARETRAALLDTKEAASPFDMLVAQQFDAARDALGQGVPPPVQTPSRLSREARDARRPLPPDVLVDGDSESVHRDPGPVRAARTVRTKQREHS